jgi:hypothetical protein
MGMDETTAVFCISEQQAYKCGGGRTGSCTAGQREDATRSLLGLQVELANASRKRVWYLAEEGWRQQAPNLPISG